MSTLMEKIMANGKKFLQEIVEEEVDEIVEKVAKEEPELLVEEEKEEKHQHLKKMNKDDFLKSVGMDHRPGSHRAITAWEEYQAS